MQKIMGKLQNFFVFMNFVLIFAKIIALPIGRASQRNSGHFIFAKVENLTSWPTGWAFMLAWLSPIWTIGGKLKKRLMELKCKIIAFRMISNRLALQGLTAACI